MLRAVVSTARTIAVVLLIGGPALQTIIYRLRRFSFNGPSTWVGFVNYAPVFQTFTWNTLAAATVISLIPPILLAVIFQRYIVSGLSAGSVK